MSFKKKCESVRARHDVVEIEAELESSGVTAGRTEPAPALEQPGRARSRDKSFFADIFNEPHD